VKVLWWIILYACAFVLGLAVGEHTFDADLGRQHAATVKELRGALRDCRSARCECEANTVSTAPAGCSCFFGRWQFENGEPEDFRLWQETTQ